LHTVRIGDNIMIPTLKEFCHLDTNGVAVTGSAALYCSRNGSSHSRALEIDPWSYYITSEDRDQVIFRANRTP
jgi:hypothetical protein